MCSLPTSIIFTMNHYPLMKICLSFMFFVVVSMCNSQHCSDDNNMLCNPSSFDILGEGNVTFSNCNATIQSFGTQTGLSLFSTYSANDLHELTLTLSIFIHDGNVAIEFISGLILAFNTSVNSHYIIFQHYDNETLYVTDPVANITQNQWYDIIMKYEIENEQISIYLNYSELEKRLFIQNY
eukprot:520605_1